MVKQNLQPWANECTQNFHNFPQTGDQWAIPFPPPSLLRGHTHISLEAVFKMAIAEDFGENHPCPPRKSKPF